MSHTCLKSVRVGGLTRPSVIVFTVLKNGKTAQITLVLNKTKCYIYDYQLLSRGHSKFVNRQQLVLLILARQLKYSQFF